MKRKVIQIAGSTQLVSLPRKWAKAHNISRGQEIDVEEDGDRIVIASNNAPLSETAEVNISQLGQMINRVIGAYYRKGVDELKVSYDRPELAETVHESLGHDTVGFEMLEQGRDYCVVKYVTGSLEEFDSLLRRMFMLLNSMSEESVKALKLGEYKHLKNLALLEEANNKFATICKRFLNKGGRVSHKLVGPLYHIVEELEKLADEFKYVCQHYSVLDSGNLKLNKGVLDTFALASGLIRDFYELYYKFDKDKLVAIKEKRVKVIDEAHDFYKRKLSHADYWLLHHSVVLANSVFELTDAYLVLTLPQHTR
ncbi:AbrB/MazE/SpoVT family DNA-binding domain-containing protein [Candidatus Woesearchaeota archaeon]|nr:AbrB/MazE/SpoVT family DNA-binding domain-containing protein [Candidatus Woesearchaeota archaeon]